MLVPLDFEKVWKERDNRTQEKVLERSPPSRINVRHLVLVLSGSERVWVAEWCLLVSGSCSWVPVFICCLFTSLVGNTSPRFSTASWGCWAVPLCWNSQEKTPAMVTEGLLWKEGRNCSVTEWSVKYRPRELWEHYFQLELVAIFTLNYLMSKGPFFFFLMRNYIFLKCYPQHFLGVVFAVMIKIILNFYLNKFQNC